MVLQLPRLALQFLLNGYDILLAGSASFFPFLPPLVPFLMSLVVALGGGAWLPPVATFVLPRMKVAPTASSLEACWVVMSSSSLVVFG
jgi:hypothetical protein